LRVTPSAAQVWDDPHDGLQQSQKRVAKPDVPEVGGTQAVLLDAEDVEEVEDDDDVLELRLDDRLDDDREVLEL
jgi:hypothetical protein